MIFGNYIKNRFPKNIDVYFVNTLEETELEKEVNKFKNYKMVIGFGGGQALDIAKYFSWKCNLKLFQFPTSISVDAVLDIGLELEEMEMLTILVGSDYS